MVEWCRFSLKGGDSLDQTEKFLQIYRQYYSVIRRYCSSLLLNDPLGAEDCTQEVFFILARKLDITVPAERIRIWLYKTADLVILNYRRREQKHSHESLDDLSFNDISLSDDGGLSAILDDSPLDILTQSERELITAYYLSGTQDKLELAEQHGLTLSALYSEIHRIKTKLRNNR